MAERIPISNTTDLPPLPEPVPPTTNPWLLAEGSIALYNQILILASLAVIQHFIIFGIFALLRGFSPKRLLDLHYLTLLFALTLAFAPVVFVLDYEINQLKLLFFLEHEAIEYLILVRVVAPPSLINRRAGAILFAAWTALFVITAIVVTDKYTHKGAMFTAWGAFISDSSVGVAGAILVKRWMQCDATTEFGVRRVRAEGLAGIGFMCHGFITISVPPVFTLVLYNKLRPEAFAYAWMSVWMSGYFAVAFCIPAIGLFFWNIWWCCGRRKRNFPGQVQWDDTCATEEDDYRPRRPEPQRFDFEEKGGVVEQVHWSDGWKGDDNRQPRRLASERTLFDKREHNRWGSRPTSATRAGGNSKEFEIETQRYLPTLPHQWEDGKFWFSGQAL